MMTSGGPQNATGRTRHNAARPSPSRRRSFRRASQLLQRIVRLLHVRLRARPGRSASVVSTSPAITATTGCSSAISTFATSMEDQSPC
eukprot:6394843-Prymnesium_polylepis.1